MFSCRAVVLSGIRRSLPDRRQHRKGSRRKAAFHRALSSLLVFSSAIVPLVRLQAAAEPLQGPITVSTYLKLQSDVLVPPDGVGIRVLGPNARIDLNGFQVVGDGSGTGIQVTRQTGAVISRGAIRGCTTGVLLTGGSRHTLRSLTVEGNSQDGIWLLNSHYGEVSGCTVIGNGRFGVYADGGGGHLVAANRILANRSPRESGGITLAQTVTNVIRENLVQENGNWGIRLLEGSGWNGVMNNNVLDTGTPSLEDPGPSIQRVVSSPQPGMILGGGVLYNEIRGNTLKGNSIGLYVWEGAIRNRIRLNVAVENSDLDLANRTPDCSDNLWFGNRFEKVNRPCEP